MDEGKARSSTVLTPIIRGTIDDFWKEKISEEEARKRILDIISNPEEKIKIWLNGKPKAAFEKMMGKNRLEQLYTLVPEINNGCN